MASFAETADDADVRIPPPTAALNFYNRGAYESLIDRMRADKENWAFDVSVVMVTAIAGIFLLATLLMLLGLVYLFRKRDDMFRWRAFGSRRFDSELFSSVNDGIDVEDRGSLCDGMGPGAADGGEAASAAARCDRCSRAMPRCPSLENYPLRACATSDYRSLGTKRKVPQRSRTMWSVERKNSKNSESLLPLITSPGPRGAKSRSYEMLKEAETSVDL